MKIIDGRTFFDIHETANVLGVTLRTIQRWLSLPEGKLPKHAPKLNPRRFPNRHQYFEGSDLKSIFTARGISASDADILAMARNDSGD